MNAYGDSFVFFLWIIQLEIGNFNPQRKPFLASFLKSLMNRRGFQLSNAIKHAKGIANGHFISCLFKM